MSYGHGGPAWGPGGQGPDPSDTPDWVALADDAEIDQARRRRWLIMGGTALAVVALGVIVLVAVMSQGGDEKPTAQTSAGTSTEPEPTFSDVKPPPPADPRDYIGDPAKDTAPITPAGFFPDATVKLDGGTYARKASDTTRNCAASVQGDDLRSLLRKNGCQQLMRATFTKGDLAITVGVAVFNSETAALDTADKSVGNVQSLVKGGVPKFCRGVVCQSTTYTIGRYTYFTIAGYTDSKKSSTTDAVSAAAQEINNYAYEQIMNRGRILASAAASEAAKQ